MGEAVSRISRVQLVLATAGKRRILDTSLVQSGAGEAGSWHPTRESLPERVLAFPHQGSPQGLPETRGPSVGLLRPSKAPREAIAGAAGAGGGGWCVKHTAMESASAAEEEGDVPAPMYRSKERAKLTCTRQGAWGNKRGRNASISPSAGSAHLRTKGEG